MAEYTITKKIVCCDYNDLPDNLKDKVKEEYFSDTVNAYIREDIESFFDTDCAKKGYETYAKDTAFDIFTSETAFKVRKITFPDLFLTKILDNEEYLNFLLNDCSNYEFKIDYSFHYSTPYQRVSFSFYCENETISDSYQEKVYQYVEDRMANFCEKVNEELSKLVKNEVNYFLSDDYISDLCTDIGWIFEKETGKLHSMEEC